MSNSCSNFPSVNLLRLGVKTRFPRLNSLSTGALEGIVVLYLRNNSFIYGYFSKHSRVFAFLKNSMASVPTSDVPSSSSIKLIEVFPFLLCLCGMLLFNYNFTCSFMELQFIDNHLPVSVLLFL